MGPGSSGTHVEHYRANNARHSCNIIHGPISLFSFLLSDVVWLKKRSSFYLINERIIGLCNKNKGRKVRGKTRSRKLDKEK